ncbi:hypothetical protein [Brevibacterium siliguriense]|uniref:hypothetical protein n=1 Tax=Brevibacterium siliguriense TaxID=1136497 RepID=UPI001E3C9232|nr:hypothetical protein [Brevibacterium siliguriense]
MDTVAETSLSLVSGPVTTAGGEVFRVFAVGVVEAFSALSASDVVGDEPAFVFGAVVLAADDGFDELPAFAFAALASTNADFAGVDLEEAVFEPVALEVDDLVPDVVEPAVLEAVALEAVDFEPEVLAAEVLAGVDFVAAVLEVADFVPAALVSDVFDRVVVDDPPFDDPGLAVVGFAAAVFDTGAFVSVPVSDVLVVDRDVPADFGLRRREDCMEAAGSVRAVRDVFVSPLSSSVCPPEKKTSTGRSLELASGINAPSPRPKPLFLRSATTYSSICNFFSSFPIRQGTAGMWVI